MGMMRSKRVVFTAPMTVVLEEAPLPEAIPGKAVLVRSEYSLISPGTELALFTGTHIGFKDPEITWARYPLSPGYATVGTVEAVGPEPNAYGPKPGQRILHYGSHADAVLLDPDRDLWLPLKENMDGEQALFARFAQIASTAVTASSLAGPALVLGAGIVGNLCAQLFRERAGRQVAIADRSAARLALAARCGIGTRVDTTGRALDEAIHAAAGDLAFSTIVEATGVPALVPEALRAVQRGGEVILLGSSRGTIELDVYKLVHRKATSLVGAHESRYPQRAAAGEPSQTAFADAALGLIASGALVVEPFLTDRIAPAELDGAYRALLDDPASHLGVVIDWRRA